MASRSQHAPSHGNSPLRKAPGVSKRRLFLDSIAEASARHLVHYNPADAPVIARSVGGLAPSNLRRCIALMEARLEGGLGLVNWRARLD